MLIAAGIAAVQDFIGGAGPVLQARLQERAAKAAALSWEYQPERARIGGPSQSQQPTAAAPAHTSAIEPAKNSWLIDWWNAVSYVA